MFAFDAATTLTLSSICMALVGDQSLSLLAHDWPLSTLISKSGKWSLTARLYWDDCWVEKVSKIYQYLGGLGFIDLRLFFFGVFGAIYVGSVADQVH